MKKFGFLGHVLNATSRSRVDAALPRCLLPEGSMGIVCHAWAEGWVLKETKQKEFAPVLLSNSFCSLMSSFCSLMSSFCSINSPVIQCGVKHLSLFDITTVIDNIKLSSVFKGWIILGTWSDPWFSDYSLLWWSNFTVGYYHYITTTLKWLHWEAADGGGLCECLFSFLSPVALRRESCNWKKRGSMSLGHRGQGNGRSVRGSELGENKYSGLFMALWQKWQLLFQVMLLCCSCIISDLLQWGLDKWYEIEAEKQDIFYNYVFMAEVTSSSDLEVLHVWPTLPSQPLPICSLLCTLVSSMVLHSN